MAIEPVRIELQEVSKRFVRQWVLREVNGEWYSGNRYGIAGRNGSGKSTLMRLLAGLLSPTRGLIRRERSGKEVATGEWYRSVSWTGPYLEVAEELTVEEVLRFYFALKPLRPGLNVATILERIELTPARNRRLSACSSGMRQRVLLATAIYAATPLILLDEPSLTLDNSSTDWLNRELSNYTRDRLLIIASNEADDLVDCDSVMTL
jgi:ABC-type multidrug transport system ATPase subunit